MCGHFIYFKDCYITEYSNHFCKPKTVTPEQIFEKTDQNPFYVDRFHPEMIELYAETNYVGL